MSSDLVTLERVRPGVALVTMRRESKRNALNAPLLDALAAVSRALHDDTTVKAVVLTGSSRMFSAGADLSFFDAVDNEPDINQVRRLSQHGRQVLDLWESLPMLTIAAVSGGAVGGGFALALTCDWRVFASDAWATVPEPRLGMSYGWGSLPRLAALAGPARAKWIAILGRRHTAADLNAWNLAEQIAPPGQAVTVALGLAEEVASLPTLPPQMIKRTINGFSLALARTAAFSDIDDLVVCLADPEGRQSRHAQLDAGARRRR